MRILIINPNSDPGMTRRIEEAGRAFAGGTFEVVCLATPGAPRFIDTYEDRALAAPGMAKLLRDHHDGFDAFVVACHCDPNLDLMKEIGRKPVVGIGEASMKMATMLGHRFSVLSTAARSIPNKEALIERYGLRGQMASVRAPEDEGLEGDLEERFFRAGRAAIDEDAAEVIVLGCAGLAGLDKRLGERLGVPVLDGVACALILASGMARCGVATSKAGRYNPGV
ncbi:MAG: Asp/Glu/hydantoin racemase [Candidatus Aminicenantes bacterium]|nr:Asp/Glu/hydantoin racemase [Candidatus Aminicenantes bacterium]